MRTQAFARYITYRRDNDELLLYLLQSLVRDEVTFQQLRNDREPLTTVTIPTADLESRVRTTGMRRAAPAVASVAAHAGPRTRGATSGGRAAVAAHPHPGARVQHSRPARVLPQPVVPGQPLCV